MVVVNVASHQYCPVPSHSLLRAQGARAEISWPLLPVQMSSRRLFLDRPAMEYGEVTA